MVKTINDTSTTGYEGFYDGMARHASMDNSKRNGLGLTEKWPPRSKRNELWAGIGKTDRVILCDVNVAKIGQYLVSLCEKFTVKPPFVVPNMPEHNIDAIHKRSGTDKAQINEYARRGYEKAKENMQSKVTDRAGMVATARNFATFIVTWQDQTAIFRKGNSELDVDVGSNERYTSCRTNLDFTPGCPSFVEKATVNRKGQTGKVELRHKTLQKELYKHLCKEAGADNVQVERPLSIGGKVDTSVRHNGRESFYEVKVDSDIRSCIREALGQLIEYAYYPSEDRAGELIIVSEAELDSDSLAYLQFLRQRFGLSLWYRRIDMNRHILKSKS